jgi:hypothetical protein
MRTKELKMVLMLLLMVIFSSSLLAQKRAKKNADEDTENWRYEIECEGVGSNGIYLIKIFSYSFNKDVAIEQSKKNAIHGVIFKGIPEGDRGCVSQPALARNSNLEQEKVDYFDAFFEEGGKYQKFVNLTTDGAVKAGDRYEIGGSGLFRRKEYKIGIVVSVNKALLRKELEDAGILRGLSSGF